MCFIEHSILIETDKNNEYVLINLLNGFSDILSKKDLNIIQCWKKSNKYQFNNQYETKLYNTLLKRKYIMHNKNEERKYKELQIEKLKKDYQKSKNNIKDVRLILTYDCNFDCSYCLESNINNNYKECLGLTDKLKEKYQNKDILIFKLQSIFQLDKKSKKLLESILHSVNNYRDNTINNFEIILQRLIMNRKPIDLKFNNCSAETSARLVDNKGDIYSYLVAVGNKNSRIGTCYPDFKYFEGSLVNRNITTIESYENCKFALLCGNECGNSHNTENNNFMGECGCFIRKLEQYIETLGYDIFEEVML